MRASPLFVVILAAGQGKRMRSAEPKVLHDLAGRALLSHVLETAQSLDPEKVLIVHGHGGDRVRAALADAEVECVEQREQLGTGHAVAQALPSLPDEGTVLVLYGDVPLTRHETLSSVLEVVDTESLGLISAVVDEPAGYGRILRDEAGRVAGIVEERDATEAQRCIKEISTGIVAAPAASLRRWLSSLACDNAQGEYYLTDIVAMAVAEGLAVRTVQPGSIHEVLGVNDRAQLAELERFYQLREARKLMDAGVTLRDPARLDIRGTVRAGIDVILDVNVVLEGDVELADGVRVGPNTVIRNASIGPGSEILGHCSIEDAFIGASCRVGPFSRIRPGTELAERVHVGNFVEVKKSRIGAGSKVNHLSYVGDTEVGKDVNLGAGTITCNYDGANKHRTVIGDGAFIGSGTELVAPVTVAAGATIGAGSTITEDAPADVLTLARARQTSVPGWERPVKKSGGGTPQT